jgi:hypothetical protein
MGVDAVILMCIKAGEVYPAFFVNQAERVFTYGFRPVPAVRAAPLPVEEAFFYAAAALALLHLPHRFQQVLSFREGSRS